jgi:CheY-like chemotaxis protein
MEKICLVDDYPTNLFILEEYLCKNYNTVSFNRAEDCIEYLKLNKSRVVLMDCKMPELSGIEATRIIKKNNPKMRVIGVTGLAMKDEIKECYESGMESVILKPINREDLLQKIGHSIQEKI